MNSHITRAIYHLASTKLKEEASGDSVLLI